MTTRLNLPLATLCLGRRKLQKPWGEKKNIYIYIKIHIMLRHFAQNFIFYGTIVSNITEPEWRAPWLGTLGYEGYGDGNLSSWGLSWATWSGLVYWGLKGALEVERLSLWDFCEGNLERGLPCWGTWRIGRTRSGDGRLFHKDHAGEPGRGL